MKKYFILAAVAATFTACSFDKDLGESSSSSSLPQVERVPLKIGAITGEATVNASRRSASTNLQDAAAATQTATTNSSGMGLYILKSGTKYTQTDASNYEQLNLASTSLTLNTPTGTTYTKYENSTTSFYYPDDKSQGVDIYLYSPHSASAPSGADASNTIDNTLSITTATDQTYDKDYYANDFLWGAIGENVSTTNGGSSSPINATKYKAATGGTTTAGYVTTSGEVIVPMYHMGSKIIIKVVNGTGMTMDKLKGAKVDFGVDFLTGTLKISDGTITKTGADIANTADTDLQYITMGKLGYSDASTTITSTTNNDGREGVEWTDTNSDNIIQNGEVSAYYCAGVIIPQKVRHSKGDGTDPDKTALPLIKITIDNTTTVYAYSPTADITFAPKKKYTFTITVNAAGIAVTTNVTDWDDQTTTLPGTTPGSGDANLTD